MEILNDPESKYVVILLPDGQQLIHLFRSGGFFSRFNENFRSRGLESGVLVKVPAHISSPVGFGACIFIPREEVEVVLEMAKNDPDGEAIYACLSSFS